MSDDINRQTAYSKGVRDGRQIEYELRRKRNCGWWADLSWVFPAGCTYGAPDKDTEPKLCPPDWQSCPLKAQERGA